MTCVDFSNSLRRAGTVAEGMSADPSREPTGLRARPEAPWALWAGVAGALAAAALSVKAILGSGGADAAAGYLLVPFIAAIAAIPCGIWGAALGHVAPDLDVRLAPQREGQRRRT